MNKNLGFLSKSSNRSAAVVLVAVAVHDSEKVVSFSCLMARNQLPCHLLLENPISKALQQFQHQQKKKEEEREKEVFSKKKNVPEIGCFFVEEMKNDGDISREKVREIDCLLLLLRTNHKDLFLDDVEVDIDFDIDLFSSFHLSIHRRFLLLLLRRRRLD